MINKMQYGLAEDSELTVASRNVGFAVGTRLELNGDMKIEVSS